MQELTKSTPMVDMKVSEKVSSWSEEETDRWNR